MGRLRPAVWALALVMVLVAGACGGGGKKTTAAKAGQSGSPTTVAGDSSTTAAAAGDASTSTTAAGGASGAGGATATTAKPSGASTPTTAAAGAGTQGGTPGGSNSNGSTAGQSPPQYQAKPQTAPGKYHYKVSGTTSFGSPPPDADLTVDPPQGSTQHSRLSTSQSTTDTTVDYQGDGVHLVDLTTTTQTGFGPPTVLRFHPNPPPLLFKAPFTAGAVQGPFDMTSDDGKTVVTVKVTIQSLNEPVATGDGQQHPAVKAEVDSNIHCASPGSCSFEGTINSTRWIGYEGLTLKDHSVTNGKFGAYDINADTTSVVDKSSAS